VADVPERFAGVRLSGSSLEEGMTILLPARGPTVEAGGGGGAATAAALVASAAFCFINSSRSFARASASAAFRFALSSRQAWKFAT
jgi:hypothetical protein